ncbi:MAG: aldo/keto reductase [Candidatus Nanopelagicales bacterium]|jgi:aryl-alcohol dehydrogenase-like predicted oxidoreductase|nr:aldo/keto reductase [Actinomycetota bacterium]
MNGASSTLPVRQLGPWQVSAVGLGAMPLSFADMLDHREQAIATIHRAIDLGVTFIDSANIYAPSADTVGHNEALVCEALSLYSGPADTSHIVVATKGGITRGEGETWSRDGSASGLKAACEASMAALGVTVISLYQHHRHDPRETYTDQMRGIAALRDLGWVREVGISNATLPELEVALEVLGGPGSGGVVSVQNEFSPRMREDREVLDRCTELGIAFLPWSPLGGSHHAKSLESQFGEFASVAAEHSATTQEIALAWLLTLSPVVIPIPGATKPVTIDSIVHSLSIELTDSQFERLSATEPFGETIYPDSELRSPLR